MNNETLSVSEACDLTRLAWELAKRQSKSDPRPLFREAAQLVTAAREAWAAEMHRLREENSPARQRAKLEERLEDSWPVNAVPYNRLVRSGDAEGKGKSWEEFAITTHDEGEPKETRFKWLVYTHEASFKKLLVKHAQPGAELYRQNAEKRVAEAEEIAKKKEEAATLAKSEAEAMASAQNDAALVAKAEKLASDAKVDAANAAEHVTDCKEDVHPTDWYHSKMVKNLLKAAKAGEFDVVTVKALYVLRSKSTAARAAKGGIGKAKKAKKTSASAVNVADSGNLLK